jgi:hypothetical protein
MSDREVQTARTGYEKPELSKEGQLRDITAGDLTLLPD